METQTYIVCFALGILGVLLHIFGMKLPAVRKRAKDANLPFTIKDYLSEDYPAIIASMITVVIAVLIIDEMVGYNPSYMRYIKFFFAFIGYTGSSILIGAFGKFDKGISAIVDAKTNELDAIKK